MYPTDSFGSMDISNPRDSSDRWGSSDPGVSLDQRNSSESIESTYSLGTSNPIKTSVGASNIGASLFYLITQRNGHQLSIISDIIYWNSDPKELFHTIRMVSNWTQHGSIWTNIVLIVKLFIRMNSLGLKPGPIPPNLHSTHRWLILL